MKILVKKYCSAKCGWVRSIAFLFCLAAMSAGANAADPLGISSKDYGPPVLYPDEARMERYITSSTTKINRKKVEKAWELFQKFITLERAYDPARFDLYDDYAVIRNSRRYADGMTRDITLNLEQMKKMYKSSLWFAKFSADTILYSNVTYTQEGQRVRIKCTRTSVKKKFAGQYELLVGPGPKGNWLIYEEIAESRP